MVSGFSKIEITLFTSVVACAAGTYLRMKDYAALRKLLVVCTVVMGRKCLVSIGNNS